MDRLFHYHETRVMHQDKINKDYFLRRKLRAMHIVHRRGVFVFAMEWQCFPKYITPPNTEPLL